jgi:hypothetical protein
MKTKSERMIAEFKRIEKVTRGNIFTADTQHTMNTVVKALKELGFKHSDFEQWARENGYTDY